MNKITIEPSVSFKKQAAKAKRAIVLFVLFYLLILVLSTGLTAGCIYAGMMLIVAFPKFITIVLGFGLASFGVLIFIFLVKFMFKSTQEDTSHLYEVTRKDQPELFSIIDELVHRIDTNFPKKVYLTPEVNAAVFYHTGFWTMFFPLKKNLKIGLGLVNASTKEELTAVLAHEFGHFSQNTLKVGSYIYNVNKAIYNMLYENDAYHDLLQKFSSLTAYFSIFAVLAARVIDGIRYLLQKMYEFVNKEYLGLSREMEFHADEIAANITGAASLQTSLLRLELADASFNSVINFYENRIADLQQSENVYEEQAFVLQFLANEEDLSMTDHLPQVQLKDLNRYDQSKLVIENQWASHPSTEDRVNRLAALTLPTTSSTENKPAMSIFKEAEKIQQELTRMIFKQVKYDGKVEPLPYTKFKTLYTEEYAKNSFPKFYNGYYDFKDIETFELATASTEEKVLVEELFSAKQVQKTQVLAALENDIEHLRLIGDRSLKVKTFDYDGQKYQRKDSFRIKKQLEDQKARLAEELQTNDRNIFAYFLAQEHPAQPALQLYYERYFNYHKAFTERYQFLTRLQNSLDFLQETLPVDEIQARFQSVHANEVTLKNYFRAMMQEATFEEVSTTEMKKDLESYLSREWRYFGAEAFNERSLQFFFTVMNHFAYLMSRTKFVLKKQLLVYQLSLIQVEHVEVKE